MMKEVLSLASGPSIEDSLGRLTRFCEQEYLYYDAVPKGDPNRVEPVDVLATVGINSQIDTAGKVRDVHLGMAANCDPLLPGIPTEADLLTFEPLDVVSGLLSAAMKARYVLLATATKVLHRKRRGLIPVLDSVVVGHYLTGLGEHELLARSWSDRSAASEAGRLALLGVREDLRGARAEIAELTEDLARAGFHGGNRGTVWLTQSGVLTLSATAGPEFLGWAMERYATPPVINPLTLCEITYEFCRLYLSGIVPFIRFPAGVRGELRFRIALLYADGPSPIRLPRGRPTFAVRERSVAAPYSELIETVEEGYVAGTEPERVAADLLKGLSGRFGLGADAVPFLTETGDMVSVEAILRS